MLLPRREARTSLLLFCICVLALQFHVAQAADWLPWWISRPVRRLLGQESTSISTYTSFLEQNATSQVGDPIEDNTSSGWTEGEACKTDTSKCSNGFVLHRQPALKCDFPACPVGPAWEIYCDPDCNGQDLCEEHCFGEEEQSIACPDSTPCAVQPNTATSCTPKDCMLSEWTDWSVEGCTGLCNRTRSMTTNACGGRPCDGRLHETKWCLSPCNPPRDCQFDGWSNWGTCDLKNMRHRFRNIKIPAAGDGTPCEGSMEIAQSCAATSTMKRDCLMSDWMTWTGCTKTCGGGQKRRSRNIQQQAFFGGKSCAASSLMDITSCNNQTCPILAGFVQDCKLLPWSDWRGCFAASSVQKLRSRIIDPLSPGTRAGKACNASLEEITACQASAIIPVHCEFSTWSNWTRCSKTCDGGQTTRMRKVETPASNGGHMCEDSLVETRVCNKNSCGRNGNTTGNCQLAVWSMWSACSSTCGEGIETRNRSIIAQASVGGRGCADAVTEVRGCPDSQPCLKQDCLWDDWTHWAQCSKSCGVGTRSRTRTVKFPPLNGGQPCAALNSTLEVDVCNTDVCQTQCVDGAWGAWSPWTHCTRTCSGGAMWRHREVQTKANHCGNPVAGNLSEFHHCNTLPCAGDKDCEFADWKDWGGCSKGCGGSQSRSRSIKTNSTGAGSPCTGPVTIMRSCDKLARKVCGDDPVDCELNGWQQWSACSVTCEGGQQTRTRTVKTYARNGGKPCNSSLTDVAGCTAGPPCNPMAQDCKWGPWSAWTRCLCDGTKLRHRQISQWPLSGVECNRGAKTEVGMCQRTCGKQLYYCIWSPWRNSSCTASCGTGTRRMERGMLKTMVHPADPTLIIGKLHSDMERCNGTEVIFQRCNLPICTNNCTPQDCTFSAWSDWSTPTGSDCNGLCTRHRTIGVHGNHCGAVCDGATTMTKPCVNGYCLGQDCTLGLWTPWNRTKCSGNDGQKFRHRDENGLASNGGSACSGSMNLTATCNTAAIDPINCEFSDWGSWSQCTRSCGQGKQTRNRDVKTHAAHGGAACSGGLRSVKGCKLATCPSNAVNCTLSDWGDWFGCDNKASSQAYRQRHIVQQAVGAGKPCDGRLKETGHCPELTTVDCAVSVWNEWGICQPSCGSGQKSRTREVKQHARNNGTACTQVLHMTTACATDPCPDVKNCEVGDWSRWSSCSPTCGQGLKKRHRIITKPALIHGVGCTLDLQQVASCKSIACTGVQDCNMTSWSTWGPCQQAIGCGVGYRNRSRQVRTPAGKGGHPCKPGLMNEVQPNKYCPGTCHEHCIDGMWQAWGSWSACSVTCGKGGSRSRTRDAHPASHCGKPAVGAKNEYEGCSANITCRGHVDCQWSNWGPWMPCSASCGGSRERRRKVLRYAERGGKPCHGATLQLGACNPAPHEAAPLGCPASQGSIKCFATDWQQWSHCSRPCEGGYMTRSRAQYRVRDYKITMYDQIHSVACNTTLEELIPCNTQDCAVKKVNCEWGAWQDWGRCDPQSSNKKRMRVVSVQPQYGMDCEGPQEEVAPCTTTCNTNARHYCMWSLWSSWSVCSKPCGPEGRMTRKRKLVATREAYPNR